MTGTHVAPGSNPLTPGSPIAQLSVSELDGHFPSRKDDLMRLGEVLLKILDSSYIRHLSGLRKPEDYKARKLATVPSECCRRKDTNMVPFDRYFEIVKTLGYDTTPDYDVLKSLFL